MLSLWAKCEIKRDVFGIGISSHEVASFATVRDPVIPLIADYGHFEGP